MQKTRNISKIRSDLIHEKNDSEKHGKSRELFFCYENALLHSAWKIPPIDMTPKCYFLNKNPYNKPCDRMTRDEEEDVFELPKLQPYNNRDKFKKSHSSMLLHFRIDSANTDRRKTLHAGFHKKGKYAQPRPHHFRDDIHRPLDNTEMLGKQDFKVEFEHDPQNIKFKKYTLDHLKISELSSTSKHDVTRSNKDGEMKTYKQKEKKFDTKLLLPKTKYRKGRDPQDVLYDKIVSARNLPVRKDEFQLLRPDIYDNTTVDLLEITRKGARHKCLNHV